MPGQSPPVGCGQGRHIRRAPVADTAASRGRRALLALLASAGMALREGRVLAGDLDVAYLETGGTGPLALCLHGFPDSAYTWRHLLPELAAAGYRAVAPFSRGYAPTGLPGGGHVQTGVLGVDAVDLHEALGGDCDAVVIGHDWGAVAAYAAAGLAPQRWRRVVTLATPPALGLRQLTTYPQARRSFYMWLFQLPFAEKVVAANDFDFLARLWADWSPGYDAAQDVDHARACLREPANLCAVLDYYRTMLDPTRRTPELELAQAAAATAPPQPTLYLHGRDDGCIGVENVDGVAARLASGSRVEVVDGAGHFLHLERPVQVNAHVLGFLVE
ncbi:MAG: alpha/beta fold hydrolase [Mycobacteriales bacterium]